VGATGSYGLLVADACNATIFDPETGAGAAGRSSGTQTYVGQSGLGIIPAFDSALLGGVGETDEADIAVPTVFGVEQNYPNPFELSTTIEVALPEATNLRVEVFNVIGQRVRMLTDDAYGEGVHVFRFDAEGLTGGTYIYRVTTPQASVTRRMMIIK
jgi:hypothetical protein